MTTLYCAICGGRFQPDTDHVEIDAERVMMEYPNEKEMFVMHTDCWDRLTGGWMEPA